MFSQPKLLTTIFTLLLTLVLVVSFSASASAGDGPVTFDDWHSGDAAFECSQIGDYDGAFKVDAAAPDGIYSVDAYGRQIAITDSNGYGFSWNANFGVGAVIVKAGTGANVWFHNPQTTWGVAAFAYENKQISHVSFCWQYMLDVQKTATTAYTRTYQWGIEKQGSESALKLSAGQSYTVNYTIDVAATATDSDWAATGEIIVRNQTPIPFTVVNVSDQMSGDIDAPVSCTPALPVQLAPGAALACTYQASLPNAEARLNTATVIYFKVAGQDRHASATADVQFGAPTKEVDACIAVNDDKFGDLGLVCAGDAPTTFAYTLTAGPFAQCGDVTFVNTASFVAQDTQQTGIDTWTVAVNVPCQGGCTLTPGYWKTHSKYGPAPYDDTWLQLGEDTPFYSSGLTAYQVLWTSPGGNAYFILAHAYLAAQLNFLNGADPTATQAAFDQATALFTQYSPDQVSAMKGKSGNEMRSAFTGAGSVLDAYNNGFVGPQHCSE